MKKLLGYLALITIPGLIFLLSDSRASAATQEQNAEVTSFQQKDLDGDALPEIAIIGANYIGGSYQITVYDQGQDMAWSDIWQTGTDFVDDTWLFQPDNSDSVKLIIRFSNTTDGYTAELYDDENNDGTISYHLTNSGMIDITEAGFPAVKVIAQQPWVLPNGIANPNIRIFVYKPIFNEFINTPVLAQWLPTDGRPDYEYEIVDSNADGIPDYELRQSFPDLPYGWYPFLNGLSVNSGRRVQLNYEGFFLWPYLGSVEPATGSTADLSAPIRVDWQSGQIQGIGSLLALSGPGDAWSFWTGTPIVKNAVNELDWERFGNYFYSGSSTMDLVTHLIQGVPGDPQTVLSGSKVLHQQNFAISWHFRNLGTLQWDFKLEMAGLHKSPPTLVNFKDFSLREVPFEQALTYFTEQKWAFATFVAAEGNLYDTNEGLYEWETRGGVLNDAALIYSNARVPDSDQAQSEYLMGRTDKSPAQYYTDIRAGFRGEYADLMESKAQLYFSSIDHKLHLLKASKGVWNLDGKREIHYENLGGETLNKWSVWQDGKELKSFYYASGYNLLAEGNEVKITKAGISPVLFTTLPPTNKDEWTQLGAELEKYKPNFTADDLDGMFQQFSGLSIAISGASLSDFRLLQGGFRFVLDLHPGYTVNGADWKELRQLAPGQYLVVYDPGSNLGDGSQLTYLPWIGLSIDRPAATILQEGISLDDAFQLSPITPTQLSLEMSTQKADAAGTDGMYRVNLKAINAGNQDSQELEVSLQARCGDNSQEILRAPAKVLGEAQINWAVDWLAQVDQDCQLSATLSTLSGVRIAQTRLDLPATETQRNNTLQVLRTSTQNDKTVPAVVVLGFMGMLGGVTFWVSRHFKRGVNTGNDG